jgi:hypothetical protein
VSTRRSWLALFVAGLPLALVVGWAVVWTRWAPELVLTDSTTYLAAGERLNAGHFLYQLVPGDRPIDLRPPYWTVPLLSPPFIAVLWRPLAALGDAGLLLGWAASAGAMLVSLVYLVRRPGGAVAVALLSPFIGLGVLDGNVTPLLLLGAVAVYHWRDDPRVGLLLGAMAAVKIAPVILFIYFVGRRQWSVVAYGATAFLVCASIGVLGAGFEATRFYVFEVAMRIHPASPLVAVTGLAALPLFILVTAGLGGLISWRSAVVAMVLGNPVLNLTGWPLLLAAVVPMGREHRAVSRHEPTAATSELGEMSPVRP